MANHVDAETKAAMVADVPLSELAERAVREGGSLLDYFTIVRSTVMSALQRANAVDDYTGTAALAKRATEINREIGRLTGELLNSAPVSHFTQNNVFLGSPAMAQLEAMLIEKLAPFPDAMRAVLTGLQALDGTKPPMIDASPLEPVHAA